MDTEEVLACIKETRDKASEMSSYDSIGDVVQKYADLLSTLIISDADPKQLQRKSESLGVERANVQEKDSKRNSKARDLLYSMTESMELSMKWFSMRGGNREEKQELMKKEETSSSHTITANGSVDRLVSASAKEQRGSSRGRRELSEVKMKNEDDEDSKSVDCSLVSMDSVNLPTDIKNEVKEEKEKTPLAAKTVKPKPRVINGRNKGRSTSVVSATCSTEKMDIVDSKDSLKTGDVEGKKPLEASSKQPQDSTTKKSSQDSRVVSAKENAASNAFLTKGDEKAGNSREIPVKGDKGREKKSTDAVDDKIDYAALFKKRNKKSQKSKGTKRRRSSSNQDDEEKGKETEEEAEMSAWSVKRPRRACAAKAITKNAYKGDNSSESSSSGEDSDEEGDNWSNNGEDDSGNEGRRRDKKKAQAIIKIAQSEVKDHERKVEEGNTVARRSTRNTIEKKDTQKTEPAKTDVSKEKGKEKPNDEPKQNEKANTGGEAVVVQTEVKEGEVVYGPGPFGAGKVKPVVQRTRVVQTIVKQPSETKTAAGPSSASVPLEPPNGEKWKCYNCNRTKTRCWHLTKEGEKECNFCRVHFEKFGTKRTKEDSLKKREEKMKRKEEQEKKKNGDTADLAKVKREPTDDVKKGSLDNWLKKDDSDVEIVDPPPKPPVEVIDIE